MADSEAQVTAAPAAAGEKQARYATVTAAGGLLGAVAASSCCLLPLVLFSLGVTGAWMGNLVALEPYQPLFVAVTVSFLGYGYFLVLWRPKRACADGACARPAPRRLVKTALIVASVLVATAVAYPFVAPIFLTA